MKKHLIYHLFITFCCVSSAPAQIYTLDARVKDREVLSGHLKMGGSNFLGDSLAVNSYFLSLNGIPYFPVAGEFHYSRYPNRYWDEQIRKMKAGGIRVVASYVFWNMHEEIEGKFNWEGDNNLRKFVELCAANGMKFILRIGPFCHGEIRNGGLPDWLMGKPLMIRSNDPQYLAYVDRLYGQIAQQVNGLFFRDGGPIIAVQLDNEYQSASAPWGLTYAGQPPDKTEAEWDREVSHDGIWTNTDRTAFDAYGNEHMANLKALAEKHGLSAPLFTATGWGKAAVVENETLPVTAAYPYPNWSPAEPSLFYLYRDLQKTPDYSPVRYKSENYPYIPAEMGGGIMVKYSRRPVVPPESLDALANRFLGSGANGIGYYMYHGGLTPKGKVAYFSDEAFGYPKISYDFQAPLSAFGKPSASFNRLKILHLFLQSFGWKLAPMQLVLPLDPDGIDPADPDILRYSMRVKGDEGFLFLNNFQDHAMRRDFRNIRFRVRMHNGDIIFPEKQQLNILKDESVILPVNLELGELRLHYATAQLLARGKDEKGEYFIFFAPEAVTPEFSFRVSAGQHFEGLHCRIEQNSERVLVYSEGLQPAEIRITTGTGLVRILVIDKQSALDSWLCQSDSGDKLLITPAMVIQERNSLEFLSRDNPLVEFNVYPGGSELQITAGSLSKEGESDGLFDSYQIRLPAGNVHYPVKTVGNKLVIDISEGIPDEVDDVICRIPYIGDTGQGFIHGELVIDHFYHGVPWEISLKHMMDQPDVKEILFYFRPLYRNAVFLNDLAPGDIPDFDQEGSFLEIGKPGFFPEYRVKARFKK